MARGLGHLHPPFPIAAPDFYREYFYVDACAVTRRRHVHGQR